MGGHPYWYVVDYADDVQGVLDALRTREFEAGRYNPAMTFPMEADEPAPGCQHATIEEALEAAMEDGTRSILDISAVADKPDYCAAAPYTSAELQDIVGTARPDEALAQRRMNDLLEPIQRGMARYVILYSNDVPAKVLFLGYSFD